MHGRVKVRTTAEQQEIKRKERAKKVQIYRAGIDKVFKKRNDGEFDEEILEISAQLLCANPDIYTLWNIRRETLQAFEECRSKEQMKQIMEMELQLTERSLLVNPKSYGAWHHRTWVLSNMPEPNWTKELALCNKYLDLDERNFHTWNYRQFVVSKANVPPSKEFEYTSAKISTNFSNYSSWHYRSRLLPLLYPDPSGLRVVQEDKHKEELELVQNAAFTDPNDQSAWFYQRWLLGCGKQPFTVQNALVSPDIVFITLSHELSLDDIDLQILKKGKKVQGSWQSSNGKSYSHVWIFVPSFEMFQGGDKISDITMQVTLKCSEQLIDVPLVNVKDKAFTSSVSQFGLQFSEGLTSVLEEELDSCSQLLEMEPDSKWTLLTSILLMQAIDRKKYKEETMEKLTLLCKVDPLRRGYYNDLRSRYLLEYAIAKQNSAKLELCEEINLSNKCLTALYHMHHLSLLLFVDLSGNELKFFLDKLHVLQNCQVLKLEKNKIQSLAGMPELRQLREISLRNNKIADPEELEHLAKCKKLRCINLLGNPVHSQNSLTSVSRGIMSALIQPNNFTVTNNDQ